MTVPVTDEHKKVSTDGMEDQTMCFWLPSEYQSSPPAPMSQKIFIQEREAMKVYVRTFGGFALSTENFEAELEKLKQDLGEEPTKKGVYYSTTYNAPFEVRNRRN